jgi:hypothetical protein
MGLGIKQICIKGKSGNCISWKWRGHKSSLNMGAHRGASIGKKRNLVGGKGLALMVKPLQYFISRYIKGQVNYASLVGRSTIFVAVGDKSVTLMGERLKDATGNIYFDVSLPANIMWNDPESEPISAREKQMIKQIIEERLPQSDGMKGYVTIF